MLNFRKLKQDYSPTVLKEGKSLQEKGMVGEAKITKLDNFLLRISSQVVGNFDHAYKCEVEVDRERSVTIDSECACPNKYDCQHLAALLFHVEENLNELIVTFSKDTNLEKADDSQKSKLRKTIKEAENQEIARKGRKHEKELLNEYISASKILGKSPFFTPEEEIQSDKAEIAIIFEDKKMIEIQMALKLPFRSKPLYVPDLRQFLDALRYEEPCYLGSKRYFFTQNSFDPGTYQMLRFLIDYARFPEIKDKNGERNLRMGALDPENFGNLLASTLELVLSKPQLITSREGDDEELKVLPRLYVASIEEPLKFSSAYAEMRFELEYLISSAPKILLKPSIVLDQTHVVHIEEANFFEASEPGMIHRNVYYRFEPTIKRKHLRNMFSFRDLIIPEPLFGTFVENSLPELMRFAKVANHEVIERFVTLPFAGQVGAVCDISYLNGELEASLNFVYNKVVVPASSTRLSVSQVNSFVTKEGILARNLTEEQKIVEDLFQDFVFVENEGVFSVKSERKIVEFMTEVIPKNQQLVNFNCPENLMDQFIYDETHFKLHLKETSRIDQYEVDLTVEGHLNGLTLDILWDCLASKKAYVELSHHKKTGKKKQDGESFKNHKILVLNLEKLAPVVQIFDEIGINLLDNHKENRPLWSLASIEESLFEGLPIEFKITPKLMEIQKQMLGLSEFKPKKIPSSIQATPRSYQIDGISWLERLRKMHLNGILADDMGLGKTLQAIVAVTQHKEEKPKALSIIVCPTSLVYNWKEEFNKFNSELRVLPVDGTPAQRKKLLSDIDQYDAVITSYSLLQKDIEFYKTVPFSYAILDEAQHIKNRGTRNAKSVKMIQAMYRLILTGTPIENSLEELWSLFDFLMPGLLSTYERFIEKYVKNLGQEKGDRLETLRKKVVPFILRRMKSDVLSELPPVSDIVYHCHLSEVQQELYRSYADSAREELSKLVKREGFDRVQIHVLATLTRLKQICCHPAIFAKEKAEVGDSSKYDMLLELVQSLIEGRHKTVIFSQYTRMLQIMREDLQKLGIRFEYLDGSSKNRLGIVKKFNEDENISVFLVSLKAGGSGLNLVGADTVIHYDLWWNPAVENQATDRVNRLGQKKSVSSYKLVTLNTIEEKIIELQNRKRELVKQVVSCDEEAISKLTWEEVLELLQT